VNRKLRQRRPLRARLPRPADVGRALARALKRGAAALALIVAFAGVAAAAVFGWAWVRSTPRFSAREVVVTGSARVDAAEVRRRTGIEPGTNLFALSLADVERRLAASPWIEDVRAHRELPGRLVVEVKDKQAVALVLSGSPYLADREGRPFKRARLDSGEADGLPVVTGIERRLFVERPEAAEALVRHALALVEAWRRAGERPSIGEVHLDERGATLFTWDGGVGVRIGRADGPELETRLQRFDEVWAALSLEERAACRTVYLDGTTRPDRVTVRLNR
jgi:cell division protein FtsQ